jgi:tRNA(Ile)-lysidine synthase TilS/MesJ
MIKHGDVIGYEDKEDYRQVVLKEILKMISKKGYVEIMKMPTKKKVTKIAMSNTTDIESKKIIYELIKGKSKNLENVKSVNKKNIKPLYLFLDKEVLLYAKLKNLKFSKVKKEDANKINKFVNDLETKHPEIKWAIVKGFLEVE